MAFFAALHKTQTAPLITLIALIYTDQKNSIRLFLNLFVRVMRVILLFWKQSLFAI